MNVASHREKTASLTHRFPSPLLSLPQRTCHTESALRRNRRLARCNEPTRPVTYPPVPHDPHTGCPLAIILPLDPLWRIDIAFPPTYNENTQRAPSRAFGVPLQEAATFWSIFIRIERNLGFRTYRTICGTAPPARC
ncbi:MAG TPA: hypothetical protein VIO61_09115 [Anaerolineaceae bacterium]